MTAVEKILLILTIVVVYALGMIPITVYVVELNNRIEVLEITDCKLSEIDNVTAETLLARIEHLEKYAVLDKDKIARSIQMQTDSWDEIKLNSIADTAGTIWGKPQKVINYFYLMDSLYKHDRAKYDSMKVADKDLLRRLGYR